jgi:hypothetical protein
VSASRAPRLGTAAGLVGLMLAAGCSSSSPSYAALAKIARAVPVPAGVTFVREDDVPDQNAFDQLDREVVLVYSNTTMNCVQLGAAWRAAVQQGHWHIVDDSGTGPGAFYLSRSGIPVVVDPGGETGSCPHPDVVAEKTN